jgi:hypothetical protein
MRKVDEGAETQNVTARRDCLGRGLDEEAGAEDAHDPGWRYAALAGHAAQKARWLNEQQGGLREVRARE